MNNGEYKRLDKSKLADRRRTVISTEESLKDIFPIEWNKQIMDGVKKASVKISNK